MIIVIQIIIQYSPHKQYIQKKFNIWRDSFPLELIQWDTADKLCKLPLSQFWLHHTQRIICNRCGFDSMSQDQVRMTQKKKCLLAFRPASLCVWLIKVMVRIGLCLARVQVRVRVLCYRTLSQSGTEGGGVSQSCPPRWSFSYFHPCVAVDVEIHHTVNTDG